MTSQRILCLGLTSVLLCSFMMGCISRSAPDVTYFSLLTVEQLGEAKPLAAMPDVSLGVGPITIPESLKRMQVVTRSQGNQYRFDEHHRWAGILEQDISTVIGSNLDYLLGTDKVAHFPWMGYFQPTHRIVVDVQQLDGDLSGGAVLIARWFVANGDGKELLEVRKSVYRQALADTSYASLVKAESQMLAELSKEIAVAVKGLVD